MPGVAIAPRIEGGPGIDVSPEGKISATTAPAVLVTPFRIEGVPTASTISQVFVDLMVIPDVLVLESGDVLLDFSGSFTAGFTAPSTTFLGAMFQFVWDATTLPEQAFFEFDPAIAAPNVDTLTGTPRLRAVVPAATVGAPGLHTVRVQWAVLAVDEQVDSFANNGNLVIQTKPS